MRTIGSEAGSSSGLSRPHASVPFLHPRKDEGDTPVAPPRNEPGRGHWALAMERSALRSGDPHSGGLAAASHQQGSTTHTGTSEQQERNGVGTGVRQRRGTTGRRLRG